VFNWDHEFEQRELKNKEKIISFFKPCDEKITVKHKLGLVGASKKDDSVFNIVTNLGKVIQLELPTNGNIIVDKEILNI
jgi:hypothetical protein